MTRHRPPPTVELYVRSLAPNGTPSTEIETIDRLRSLADRGRIGDYSIRVVGRGLVHADCCLSTETGKLLQDRLAAIDRWTVANDAAVPGITTVTVERSPVHEHEYTMTKLPHCLLLEYDDQDLAFVSPATLDDGHWAVSDHLDAIERAPTDPTIRGDVRSVSTAERPHSEHSGARSPPAVSLDFDDPRS